MIVHLIFVNTEARIPIAARRENGDPPQQRIVLDFLQISVACVALTTVERCMSRRLLRRLCFPRGEPLVARGAVEENHTANYLLHAEHLLKQAFAEQSMHFRGTNRPGILRADEHGTWLSLIHI